MEHDAHRRPSRKDKIAREVRKAIGVFVVLGIGAVAFGYAYFNVHANTRPIDNATFCPTDDKGPGSVTAILIDRTDPFTPTQQAAIRDRLDEVRDDTARYDLIEVYSVEPTQTQLLKPLFSMCNPGKAEDTSSWTGNPHLVEGRWKDVFDTPMQKLFDTILNGEEAAISPIMESIQSIAVTRLDSEKIVAHKIPRRLIVISDLIQYTKDYSQYRPLHSFGQFKTTPYYQSVRADLSGIPIEIWYVRRQKTLAIQGDKHIDFWRQYIEDQGGSVDKVWYVPGT